MNTEFKTMFGRTVRICVAQGESYIQIKGTDGKELAAAVLTKGELTLLSDLITKALQSF